MGNRLKVEEADGRIVEYEYDDLYRLIEEEITDPSEEVNDGRVIGYSYDKVGNRLTKTDSVEGVTTYTYDKNDRLLTETIDGVVTVYEYDDNGNTLSRQQGNQEMVYEWNDENRLVKVILADGKQVSYIYDADGIRVNSTIDGVSTEYLVDTNLPYAQVLEECVDEQLSVSYVYGHDLISQERQDVKSFYLVDGLGSTRVLTDENGGVTDTYNYEAFGELIESPGSTENNYRYAGEQFDEDLEQYYLRERYYDSSIGRFTRRDTYEGSLMTPLSLHKYIYANANPVIYIDTSGLYSIAEAQAAASIANTLNELELNFGLDVVNHILGGDEEQTSLNIGWTVLFPVVGMAAQSVPKFLGGSKLLKNLNDVWGVADSDVLRANIKAANRAVPKFPNAAHHIVPGSDNRFQDAIIARTHLAKLGVNSNDEMNGVFLEFRKKGVTQIGAGAIHNDIHTEVYYQEVRARILRAKNKQQAEKILREIGQELENNTFPY